MSRPPESNRRREFLRLASATAPAALLAGACATPAQGSDLAGTALALTESEVHDLIYQTGLVNVQWFGALPETGDSAPVHPQINNAIAALPEGGILYFPPGEYTLDGGQVALRSNMTVLGADRGTILRRRTGSLIDGLIKGTSVQSVVVRNLMVDLNHTGDHAQGIEFQGSGDDPCRDIRIENCRCYTSSSATLEGQTLPGIIARGVERLWVVGNRMERCQIKLGGARLVGAIVRDNHITDPHKMGISAVCQNDDSAELRDVDISHNLIENLPGQHGIYVGSDDGGGESAVAVLRDVRLHANTVSGAWSEGSRGLFVRTSRVTTENLTISDNQLRPDATMKHSIGITVERAKTPDSAVVKRVHIRGNSVSHTDHGGVNVAVPCEGLLIADNLLDGTRGIRVAGDAKSDVVIRGNVIQPTGKLGIDLDGSTGDVLRASISDNAIRGPQGYNSAGILLTAGGGFTLQAQVRNNVVTGDPGELFRAVDQQGSGDFDTVYMGNDFRQRHFKKSPVIRGEATLKIHNLGDDLSV